MRHDPDHRWQDDAACRTHVNDPELLFPEQLRGKRRRHVENEMIHVCLSCPVAAQCLDEAERMRDQWGIRGGYTAYERGWRAR